MFHTAHGGLESAPCHLWRAWMGSKQPVEGVEELHAACRGRGIAQRCHWRAWKCSMLPVEGMEVMLPVEL